MLTALLEDSHTRVTLRGVSGVENQHPARADIKRFGDAPIPQGTILAVRVANLGVKEAMLAAMPDSFFNMAHFDGFAGVLIQLSRVSMSDLRDALLDAWAACAPPQLAAEFKDARDPVREVNDDRTAERRLLGGGLEARECTDYVGEPAGVGMDGEVDVRSEERGENRRCSLADRRVRAGVRRVERGRQQRIPRRVRGIQRRRCRGFPLEWP